MIWNRNEVLIQYMATVLLIKNEQMGQIFKWSFQVHKHNPASFSLLALMELSHSPRLWGIWFPFQQRSNFSSFRNSKKWKWNISKINHVLEFYKTCKSLTDLKWSNRWASLISMVTYAFSRQEPISDRIVSKRISMK